MGATNCSRCGEELPLGPGETKFAGLCPNCVTQFMMDETVEIEGIEILERLGAGGMGVVYKAKQRDLDRVVALKVLAEKWSGDPEFVARFRREAKTLASLSHPNIVAVHDSGIEAGHAHLVMEYVDGVNLREVLNERRLAPAEALRVVHQICDALEYAHGKGVVHRDIKPENILIDRAGQVKIADFGLAKIFGEETSRERITQSNVVLGTPHYMAPEQLEAPQTVDHRADLYSLGVVFYEILTGEVPMGKFLPPSRKVEVDVRLDDVVLRALEKERHLRYQRATDVKTDLTRIERSPMPKARSPWLVIGVVVGLLGFLILGVVGSAGLLGWRAYEARKRAARERLERARQAYDRERFEEARAAAQRALALRRDDAEAQTLLARTEEAMRKRDWTGSWKGTWKSQTYKGTEGALELDVSKAEGGRWNVRFLLTGAVVPGGEALCDLTSQGRIVTFAADRIRVGEQVYEATCLFVVSREDDHVTGTYQFKSELTSDMGMLSMDLVRK